MALFSRKSKAENAQPAEERAPSPPAPRRVSVSPSELRRERRALLREREQQLRDLGGLALEMFRQDSFREHLLYERCADVAAVDERLFEVERLLDVRRPAAARCACGAPVFWGSHFCGNCGRPVGEPVVGCRTCGHALSADARFCPECGTPAASTEA
jgi:uncharacterized protein YjiS (DUF1127 family)